MLGANPGLSHNTHSLQSENGAFRWSSDPAKDRVDTYSASLGQHDLEALFVLFGALEAT